MSNRFLCEYLSWVNNIKAFNDEPKDCQGSLIVKCGFLLWLYWYRFTGDVWMFMFYVTHLSHSLAPVTPSYSWNWMVFGSFKQDSHESCKRAASQTPMLIGALLFSLSFFAILCFFSFFSNDCLIILQTVWNGILKNSVREKKEWKGEKKRIIKRPKNHFTQTESGLVLVRVWVWILFSLSAFHGFAPLNKVYILEGRKLVGRVCWIVNWSMTKQ